MSAPVQGTYKYRTSTYVPCSICKFYPVCVLVLVLVQVKVQDRKLISLEFYVSCTRITRYAQCIIVGEKDPRPDHDERDLRFSTQTIISSQKTKKIRTNSKSTMNQSTTDNAVNQDRRTYAQTSRMLRQLKRKMFLNAVQGSYYPETSLRDIVRSLTPENCDSFSVTSNLSSSSVNDDSASSIEHE